MEIDFLKIDCISDTHGNHEKLCLPGGDILIHAGDCSSEGELDDVLAFLDWFQTQNYVHLLLVPGNHDTIFELIPELMEEECKKRQVRLLNDSGCTIEGLKIWGSPILPKFCEIPFGRDRGPAIKKHWDLIPIDTEILITHGPPHGVKDELDGKHLGCLDLYKKILQTKVKLHVFGHIHAGAGADSIEGRIYVNAASLTEADPFQGPGYIRIIQAKNRGFAISLPLL